MRKAELIIVCVLGIACIPFLFLIHQRNIVLVEKQKLQLEQQAQRAKEQQEWRQRRQQARHAAVPQASGAQQVFRAPKMKDGLDISVQRYQGKERYDVQASVFSGLSAMPLDAGWHAEGGVWVKTEGMQLGEGGSVIIAGQGDGSDNNANTLLFADTQKKYSLSVSFKLLDRDTEDAYSRFHTNYFGLYLRYLDYNNFVRVDCLEAYRPAGKQFIRLLIRDNGNFIAVKNIPIEAFEPASLFDAWHTFKVIDSGDEVVVFLDQAEILKTTYTTSIPAGKKGLFANIATRVLFRNIKVAPNS
ncbi:MAG: hypothetical protein PHG31_06030 [Candidatus Omnitrophica bacterium]|nr:hypothetical protein [Candidatus Omnitrophota bacterium]